MVVNYATLVKRLCRGPFNTAHTWFQKTSPPITMGAPAKMPLVHSLQEWPIREAGGCQHEKRFSIGRACIRADKKRRRTVLVPDSCDSPGLKKSAGRG